MTRLSRHLVLAVLLLLSKFIEGGCSVDMHQRKLHHYRYRDLLLSGHMSHIDTAKSNVKTRVYRLHLSAGFSDFGRLK